MDENECLAEPCSENSSCVNSDGSFLCKCNSGFIKNNTACSDLDECQYGLSDCGPHSYCRNTFGSFSCFCESGFENSTGICKDVDECKFSDSFDHECSYQPEGGS